MEEYQIMNFRIGGGMTLVDDFLNKLFRAYFF